MRSRVDESCWKMAALMDANRLLVTAGLVVVIFVSLTLASLANLSPVRVIQQRHNVQFWLFSPMIGAIITGATFVVTITQLVLSQELGPLGDQRERMQGSIDFREDVENLLDIPISPPNPSSFLEAIIDGVQTYAN